MVILRWSRFVTSLPRGWSAALLGGALVVSLVTAGCSAGLGTLESADVLDAIRSAEASVEQARQTDLSVSAKPSLRRAETSLRDAKAALEAKDGVKALKAAEEARAQAEQALLLDAQTDTFQKLLEEQNRRYVEAADELERARKELRSSGDLKKSIRDDLDGLRRQIAELRARAEQMASEKDRSERRARELEQTLESSRERMEQLTAKLDEARSRQRRAEQRVEELSSKARAAEVAIEEAKQEAARKAREAENIKKQAKQLAGAYSERIDELKRDQQREEALRRARQAHPGPAPSALSEEEVQAARSAVQAWKSAWESNSLDRHIGYYAPNATGVRVTVENGTERRTSLSREALVQNIRSTSPQGWTALPRASAHAEGKQVVAEVPYRKSAGGSAAQNAVNIWVRKTYWEKRNEGWRIVREEWRFYNEVPKFPRSR